VKALTPNANLYYAICGILFAFFLVDGAALLVLNSISGAAWVAGLVGSNRAYFVHLFFWGCTGATITSSVFVARDKDLNETEAAKEDGKGDVRYPNWIDVWMYAQRILSSGFLAVFAAALVLAGLGYFDAPLDNATTKHKMFFVVLAMLIGLYENRFLVSMEQLSLRLFKKTDDTGTGTTAGSPVPVADEIRKLKALMDEGLISTVDFEKKKQQLLAL
jgi:hypothetical protein